MDVNNVSKYQDKTVVITGAAQGIGNALAISYAQHGANTVIIDRNDENLVRTKKQIEKSGGLANEFILDLTNLKAIENTFSSIGTMFGKVDVLINNAGLGINKTIFDVTVDDWDYVLNTNLRAAFFCSKEVSRLMINNGGGSIVNIASTRALMSEADTFPYSASKGGILSLTHSLAVSLGQYHIRVNAISPGWIETKNYEGLTSLDHRQHPAGRVGTTKDIVRACFYLTDPENDFVTGANLVVDGGMTKKMIYVE